MKKMTIVITIIVGLYTGCDTNITGSGNDISDGFLEKSADVLAEIETNPPSGTYYNDGVSTSTASGGDDLKDGYSVWNSNSSIYGLSVYESTILGLASQAYVKISNPVNTQYRRTNSAWIAITSTATVAVDSIRTGSSGSCDVESDEEWTVGTGSGESN